jgi:hypothetical protein
MTVSPEGVERVKSGFPTAITLAKVLVLRNSAISGELLWSCAYNIVNLQG